MANVDNPHGFLAVDNIFGGEYTGRLVPVAFLDTDATAAFKGSLVKFTGASLNDGDIPVVTLASPGDQKLAGAIQQFDPERDGNWTNYHRLASTQKIAYIPADPKTLYQVQEDSDGGNIDTATAIGQNVNFTAEAGDTVLGTSTMELDSGTAANTATLPIRLQHVQRKIENTGVSTDTNANWIVTINQTAELNTTGT